MGDAQAEERTEAQRPVRLTKGQRTRQRIFDAALDLFGTRGFQGVSLRDIAGVVGITHVTVLHYFPSKDDLLVELMVHRDEVEAESAREFLAGDHDAHPEDGGLHSPALRWFMHRLQRNADEHGAAPLFLRVSTEATDPSHPAHQHFVRRYAFVVDRITEAFQEEFALRRDLEPRVTPRIAAQHLVSIADGAQIQAIYASDTQRVVDDAWSYLRLIGLVAS